MNKAKQDYLGLVEKRKNKQIEKGDLISLEMPSGVMWKILPITTAQYAVSGKMPVHLLAGVRSMNIDAKEEAEMIEKMFCEDVVNMLKMVSHAFLNNVVEPKTEDSITPEMVDRADFFHFRNFVVSGGQSAKTPFVNQPIKNEDELLILEDELLILKEVADVQKKALSEVLEIADDLTAFQFDDACIFIQKKAENKHQLQRLDMSKFAMKQAIAEILYGGEPVKPLYQPDDDDSGDEGRYDGIDDDNYERIESAGGKIEESFNEAGESVKTIRF